MNKKKWEDIQIFNPKLAQLREAAPEMYEALKDIIEQAARTHLMLGADLADSINVFGKQALAKAEGREQDGL